MQPHEFLSAFVAPIERLAVPYFVTGSIATLLYGEPRLTHDIDLVVHLESKDVLRFLSAFPEDDYYCPPEEVIQIEIRRRPFAHFNLIHHATGFKADIYPDSEDELHSWGFQNRRRLELGAGQALWVAPPEYVILRKLEYYREGGSEKHLDDIRKLLPHVGESLDQSFLESMLDRRQLRQQWEKLSQPGTRR